MTVNRESITGSGPTPFNLVFDWGTATTKGNLLYLHLLDQTKNNQLRISGIRNHIESAYVLGDTDKKALDLTEVQDEPNALYLTSIGIPSPGESLAYPVLVLELEGPISIDTICTQYPGDDEFMVGGHLVRGPKESGSVTVRFTEPGNYSVEFHSLLNFWGIGDDWTGGFQEGKLFFGNQEIPFALKIDSVYYKPWYSYSPIVISETGIIKVIDPGIYEIGISDIEFYRGYNTGPEHHKTGIKLHFIQLKNTHSQK
jgi:hypothetical protein